jgi:hypothetical protein
LNEEHYSELEAFKERLRETERALKAREEDIERLKIQERKKKVEKREVST